MKALTLAFAAVLALATTSAGAHGEKPRSNAAAEPLGPIGLDGAPPSPLCRASLGAARHIHCLHNVIWHGGKEYFIDDLKEQR